MAWNGSSLGQAAVLQSGARCHGVSGIPEFWAKIFNLPQETG